MSENSTILVVRKFRNERRCDQLSTSCVALGRVNLDQRATLYNIAMERLSKETMKELRMTLSISVGPHSFDLEVDCLHPTIFLTEHSRMTFVIARADFARLRQSLGLSPHQQSRPEHSETRITFKTADREIFGINLRMPFPIKISNPYRQRLERTVAMRETEATAIAEKTQG